MKIEMVAFELSCESSEPGQPFFFLERFPEPTHQGWIDGDVGLLVEVTEKEDGDVRLFPGDDSELVFVLTVMSRQCRFREDQGMGKA